MSYNYKHNEANGEGNQDGSSYNYSWNCGVEGPTRKVSVRQMRERQIKNAFLMMLLSQGVPMIYHVMNSAIPRAETIMPTVRIMLPAGQTGRAFPETRD